MMKLSGPGLILTIALALCACTTPAPKKSAAEPPPQCLAVHVDHYFDGRTEHREAGTWLTIDGGRFKELASDPAPGCRSLDLTKMTVLPGLTDAHTHVLISDTTYSADVSAELERLAKISTEKRMTQALVHLDSLLKSGFTTIRELGNSGQYLDLALKTAAAPNASPRIFGSGPGIAIETAQFSPSARKNDVDREYTIVAEIRDVDKAIKERQARKVDVVKIFVDNDPQPGLMSQDLLDAAVKFAHQRGLKVAAHATNDAAARRAIRAGVDSIEHGLGVSSETFASMSESRIPLVATDFGSRTCALIAPHDPDPIYHPCSNYREQQARRLMSARDRGVDLVFGSDMFLQLGLAPDQRGPATLDSLVAYVEEGLSPRETIRSATSRAGRLLGDSKIGVIEVGAYADLVAYEANPLKNIEAIRKPSVVIKDGRLICGAGEKPCR